MNIRNIKTGANIGSLSLSQRYRSHLQSLRQVNEQLAHSEVEAISSSIILSNDDPEYTLIIESNEILIQIDEEILQTFIFVAQIYKHKFPELESLIPNRLDYVKVVQRIGNEMDLTTVRLNDLLTNTALMVVSVSSSTTAGKPLEASQLKECLRACEEVIQLYEDKAFILSFVQSRMTRIAPNLSALIGSQVAAQLVGLAGGITELSKIPACNIQVMGQAKHKNTMGLSASSQHLQHAGILSTCDIVVQAPPPLKKKALKVLAGKVALAARVDSFQIRVDPSEGQKLRAGVENKMEKIQEPAVARTKKALPIPEEKKGSKRGGRRVRKMKEKYAITEIRKQQNRLAMTTDNGEYGDSAMGVDQGMVGRKDTGRVRGVKIVESQFLKKQKKAPTVGASSGTTGGMSSSLAFTPVQGLELINPNAAAERVREANRKWFDAQSGFLSAAPKSH